MRTSEGSDLETWPNRVPFWKQTCFLSFFQTHLEITDRKIARSSKFDVFHISGIIVSQTLFGSTGPAMPQGCFEFQAARELGSGEGWQTVGSMVGGGWLELA